MPVWYAELFDFDNEPVAIIAQNDSLVDLLKENASDLYGHRFSILRGDRDGPHETVAYSIPPRDLIAPYSDHAHEQPIFTTESDVPPILHAGRFLPVTMKSGTEKSFSMHVAPEHAATSVPMAATSVRGATYPAELQRITELFRDTSWGNDTVDSIAFGLRGKPYRVFIQHQSPLRWNNEEGPPYRYELTPLIETGSLENSLEELDMDREADVDGFDTPEDLLGFVRSLQENDADVRVRMLDLGPKRQSYDPRKHGIGAHAEDLSERARLIGHELASDDLELNPGRRRRGRRNPDDALAAKEKYEEFHRHPVRKVLKGSGVIPAKVRELGKASAVLYRSDKNDPDTGRAVKTPINYIHDHDAGVTCYAPGAGATVSVPSWIKDCDALVVLGKCLGFDYKDASGVREAKGTRPLPDLCATPCGKALLVIQDRREVLAIIWGGGLGVEARGIVG